MIANNNLKGVGIFSLEIIHLISMGIKEEIEEIERHFESKDLVEYLSNKYDDEFFVKFDNSIYDNNIINKYFYNYVGYIEGQERRKYGIMNPDDGLLLILALITDQVERGCIAWTVED